MLPIQQAINHPDMNAYARIRQFSWPLLMQSNVLRSPLAIAPADKPTAWLVRPATHAVESVVQANSSRSVRTFRAKGIEAMGRASGRHLRGFSGERA